MAARISWRRREGNKKRKWRITEAQYVLLKWFCKLQLCNQICSTLDVACLHQVVQNPRWKEAAGFRIETHNLNISHKPTCFLDYVCLHLKNCYPLFTVWENKEVKPEALYRSHRTFLTSMGKLRKTSAMRQFESCATCHRFKWDPLPPNEVGRIVQYVRNGEGRK